MEEHELVSHIQDLGLSNKESRVYLASLSLGPASVQTIADRAAIKRVTTYVILESLLGLGLISQSVKAKKTFFVAEDPVRLERLLERRAAELSSQRADLEIILPKLSALQAVPQDTPGAKFYEGTDAVRALFSDFFTTYAEKSKEVVMFFNLDDCNHFFSKELIQRSVEERVTLGIHSKTIYTAADGPVLAADNKKQLQQCRFVPATGYPVKGSIIVFGDWVVMVSFNQNRPTGITIRSTDLSCSMKAIFEMAWKFSDSISEN